MKIEFNSSVPSQAVADRTAKHVADSGVSVSSSATADRTTLSTSAPSLSSMVSEAMKAPSVRQDKVNSLREAVSSGTYQIDAAKIAGSLMSDSE